MSVRTDVINLQVNVNNNAARNQLNELGKKAKEIAFAMDGLKKGTQAYIDKKAELKQVTAEMDNLKKQIGLTALNQKELVAELNKLKALRGSTVPFSKEFKDFSDQIAKVENRLYDVKNGVQGFASFFSKIKDEVKQFGLMAAGYLGFQFISSQFQNIIRGAGKMSDQLADLQRVAGLTAAEASNLNNRFKELNTRTSTEGLREISIIAGKLGVAKDDIYGFTAAVDQLVVALGDELGNADQITTQLGKILNVFDGEISAKGITNLGNAFVQLANTGSATGGFIADFDQRLSGIAKSAGISLGKLSGLGAGLEEMGARVESSSTAIQKLIISISADLPAAAKIAGVSTDAFTKLFKTDATEALLKYSEGLVKNKNSFAEVTAGLKDAGEEGARTIETITKLGTNSDQLRKRIDLGAKSIQESSAITEAFALKNETFGATLDKLSKEFNKLMTSPGLQNFLKAAVEGALAFIKAIKALPDLISNNKLAVLSLITGIILLNKEMTKNSLETIKNTAIKLYNATVTKIVAVAEDIATRAKLAAVIVTELLTGKIKLAAAAQQFWAYVMGASLGPLGVLLTIVGAVALALGGLSGKIKQVSIEQKAEADLAKRAADAYGEQVNQIEILKKILTSSTTSLAEKKKAQEELIKLNPDFINTLKLDADGHLKGVEAIDAYILKLKEKARVQAATELSNDLYKQLLQTEKVIDDVTKSTPKGSGLLDKIFGSISEADVKELILDDATQKRDAIIKAKKYYDDIIENGIKQGTGNKTVSTTTTVTNTTKTDANKKSGKADDNNLEQLRKDADAFSAELKKLRAQANANLLTDNQREIALVNEKYRELIDRARKYWNENTAIGKEKYAEIAAIRDAQLAALIKKQTAKQDETDYGAALKSLDNFFDAERNKRGREYANGKLNKKEYEASIKEIETTETNSRVLIALQYVKKVKRAAADLTEFQKQQQQQQTQDAIEETDRRAKETVDNKLAGARLKVLTKPKGSQAELDAKREELQLKFDLETEYMDKTSMMYLEKQAELGENMKSLDRERVDAQIEAILKWVGYFTQAITSLNQIITNKENRMLQQEKIRNNEKKKSLKNALDNKLISQAQYDKRVTEIQEEQDRKERELKRKQAKREKALALFQAIVNTAGAMAKAINNPYPLNLVLMALAGVLGGLQIAAIASQPLPEMGKGGMINNGPQHSDDDKGLHLVDPRTGKTEMLLEKGEGVLSKKTMESNTVMTVTGTPKQIASSMNAANGGASFASGAIINYKPMWMKQPQQTIKPGIVTMMARGGIIGSTSTGGDGTDGSLAFAMMTDELKGMRSDMQNWQTKIKGQWVIKELDDTRAVYDNAKKASSITQ